jgi:hypothetical protein
VVDDLADTPDTQEATGEFPGFLMQYRYRGFNNFHRAPASARRRFAVSAMIVSP